MISEKVLDGLEFLKVLDFISQYAVTDYGKNLIKNIRPFENIIDVKVNGNYVTEAKEILIKNDVPPINYLPNLSESLARSNIAGAVLSKDVIINILRLAETSRKVFNFLKTKSGNSILSQHFINNLFSDKLFEHHIRSVFDDSGEIKDSASEKLKKIRVEIREKNEQLRIIALKILRRLSEDYLVQEEYSTQRDGRIVLPVKAEHKRHVKGFIHSESATGQTVYIEPEETLELNNEIFSLSFEEKREIGRILQNLTKLIGTKSAELKRSFKAIAYLDAVFAKAKYSLEIIGSFPEINDKGIIKLIEARHPILFKKSGRTKTIPLNFTVNNDKVIVITGPNAGGKTVVLKTVGLLTAMSLSGIHIPAHPDSSIYFFTNILIDIGDKQSIEDDISTFSSHLSNINTIIDNSNERSLILLDEIGTGTDPSEGSALAAAILITLEKTNAIVLATTHHGNLKIIANENKGFQNASMEFDAVNLMPTYVLKQGQPGLSYAFEIAERIGLSKKVLKKAKKYLDPDKRKIEEFLIDLERKSNTLQSKLADLEIENSRLKGLSNLYKNKINELEKQKKKIISNARDKAEEYLKDINKKVELTIKEIRESNAEKGVIKEARKVIEKLKQKEESDFAEQKNETDDFNELRVGDFAVIKGTATDGEIVELIKDKNRAVIVSGNLKLQVKLSELKKTKNRKIKVDKYDKIYNAVENINSTRLDIRGKKPDEVEYEIIKFLDDAYAANLERIEILHGKGTGVLKKTVHDILKNNSYVKNHYFAPIEQGGEGITIVEFK